ncbi:MAG: hypothetical protein M1822_004146 [Bathelium mastoideum]|nr:MAG: hypothetical protein M1822_004146 [Bathelium mastoideum]
MKFGKEYEDALVKGEYPAEWVYSAISYRQLKKCIKKVHEELAEIGLDANTLGQLLQTGHDDGAEGPSPKSKQPFQYRFSPDIPAKDASNQSRSQDSSGSGTIQGFRPKLLFAVDKETGQPLDAYLSPDTKEYLHQLALSQRLTDVRVTEIPSTGNGAAVHQEAESTPAKVQTSTSRACMVEVPLSADSAFFQRLRSELFALERVQIEEKQRLLARVKAMGKDLCKSTEPARALSTHKSDLSIWREIFKLYMDSEIFFSTQELDHGARNSKQVQVRLEQFSEELKRRNLESKLRRRDSKIAFDQFLALNVDLFKNIRFQEMEFKAMTKILKKFDKRTSLGISQTFVPSVSSSALSQDISRAICNEVSNELITLVPQTCFLHKIEPVLMEADSDNVDETMAKFLKKYFPEEVKAKHEENIRLAGIDEYGEEFYSDKCTIM